jgi:histidine triad (HIT) family protein
MPEGGSPVVSGTMVGPRGPGHGWTRPMEEGDMTGSGEASCIFCRIVAGEIPAARVYEDDWVLGFRDVNPQAPSHLLLIPKIHISSVAALESGNVELAGRLLLAARALGEAESLDGKGYRIVSNHGADGGQTVPHLHLHLLGGRALGWPPG